MGEFGRDSINYCINCMNAVSKEDKICPFCGHDPAEYSINQRALKPFTLLDGKYLLGRVLGEGGFGITYLALDTTLELRVAIKELFPKQLASRNVYESLSNDIVVISGDYAVSYQGRLKRYEAEARRLAKLEALPGIVRVLNFFYDNNTAYMVMEYVSDLSMKEYKKIKGAQIRWKEVIEMIRPVIESLMIVHENEIIHRDISPDNILLTDKKEPVLIDFGTAVEIDEDNKTKEIELKHGYAPPEQYSKHGNQGPCTGVYGLCVMFDWRI